MDDSLPGVGHNRPVIEIGEALKEQLSLDNMDMTARSSDLMEAVNRVPEQIEDDEASGKLAAFLKQITDFMKAANAKREGAKAPYLEGGRIVDGFYAQMIQPLDKAFKTLNTRQTGYLTAKAARARREAEERERAAREAEAARRREAEKAEAERRRAEREAQRAKDDEARQAALRRQQEANAKAEEARKAEAEQRAQAEAQGRQATASDAELSRTRGEMAMASVRTTWGYEVTDITLVPPEYLMVNDRVVKAAISGKTGRRDIPGLRIFEVKAAVNR